jgi:hypothetical protein
MRPPVSNLNANPRASGLLVAGVLATSVMVNRATPSEMAHLAAVGAGVSLAVSFLLEMRGVPRNLVRADIMALCSLYFLTLFEFLFPQPRFDALVIAEETGPAINACLFAFASIAIGRHFAPPALRSLSGLLRTEFRPRQMLVLFWIAIFGGYFYMLLAVDFNFGTLLEYMMAPRFSQPWLRGRLGDWKALVGELGMILNLAPPIGGIILARRHSYTRNVVLLVSAALLFTFFYGFASGTRNVLITFVTTFSVAYAFSLERPSKRQLVAVTIVSTAVMLAATVFMLEFRNIGFSDYLHGVRAGPVNGPTENGEKDTGLFVDYNLYVIAKLITVFPDQHPYLGFEIPYLSLIRPIPRAIWPGKPEGMSMSIEDALGTQGLTLASSFVGEAYISGGLVGVIFTGLVFGAITGWWNRFGNPNNSPFGHLVFASGFFAAVISMRSMLVFTTAALPTLAAIVLGRWMLNALPRRRSTA